MSTETITPTRRTPLPNSHIELDEQGRPWIAGANTKVIEVVIDKVAWGWNAEQMHIQHPHLSLAQLHAALSYYYDHKEELDAAIDEQRRTVDALAAASQDSPGRRRLRSLGLIP